MIPQREPALVWRTSGRRFFTLRSACHHEASLAARAKYPCECETDTGYQCRSHEWCEDSDALAYGKVVTRYARLLLLGARKARALEGKIDE